MGEIENREMCTVREGRQQQGKEGRRDGSVVLDTGGWPVLKRTGILWSWWWREEMSETRAAARLLAEAAEVLFCTRSQSSVHCSK